MERLPDTVAVQTFPATEVQPTQVGESAVEPGVAVRVTVVDPVKVTVPAQFAVLPLLQAMAGVVWLVATSPVAVPPPDLEVTVMVAVAPSAGTATRSPIASATRLSAAPIMLPPDTRNGWSEKYAGLAKASPGPGLLAHQKADF
jgi:hypothetical protein